MALNLNTLRHGQAVRLTCNPTAGLMTEITMHPTCYRVRIQAIGGAGKLGIDATIADGGVTPTHYWTLPSNVGEEHEIEPGTKFLLGHTVNSGVIEIIPLGAPLLR